MRLRSLVVLVFCCVVSALLAQEDTSRVRSQAELITIPDSAYTLLLSRMQPSYKQRVVDTVMAPIYRYKHEQRLGAPATTLGDVGQPILPLIYQAQYRNGVYSGLTMNAAYKVSTDSFKYYNAPIAFSDLFYGQATQEDASIKVLIARNISKRSGLTIDYNRINHRGLYEEQAARITNVGAGIWYAAPTGRYRMYVSYQLNQLRQQLNGGITADTAYGRVEFVNRAAIPVELDGAERREVQTELRATQYFFLQKTRVVENRETYERTFTRTPGPGIRYDLRFTRSQERFVDADISEDTIFYANLLTNQVGLRQLFQHNSFVQQISLLPKSYADTTARPLTWELGLTHGVHRIKQEFVLDSTAQEVSVDAQASWQPKKITNLSIASLARFWVAGPLAGDHIIRASAKLPIPKVAILEGSLMERVYSPGFLDQQTLVAGVPIWNNDFTKAQSTHVAASATRADIGLRLGVKFHLLNKQIYLDTTMTLRQSSQLTRITQVHGSWHLRWRKMHFENTVYIQRLAGEQSFALPNLVTNHRLYYSGRWFKSVLLMQLGLDLTFYPNYQAAGFQPLLNRQIIGTTDIPQTFPDLTLFSEFEVGRFRAFLIGENMLTLAYQKPQFVSDLYPVRDASFRFGIRWRLSD